MADAQPNYRLERKRLEVQIGQLRQNTLASELRQMQLQSELEQIDENLAATERSIAELTTTLDSLPED